MSSPDDPSDEGGPAREGRSADSGPVPAGPPREEPTQLDDSSAGFSAVVSNPSAPSLPTRVLGPADVSAVSSPRPSAPPAQKGMPPPDQDPYMGRVLAGRFKITQQLGRGGMGYVYKAEQQPLGRAVALKVMNPNYASNADPEYEQRFFLEAAVASRITHPNVITVFDYGKDGDTFYIAMEFLQGHTLSRVLQDEGPFPPERAIHVTSQIARGVRAAHAQGAIHRDLKPANVMLMQQAEDRDTVKVLDFGLVKVTGETEDGLKDLTLTGIFLGSPKYMSPEQIRNQHPDARADIYSLGVMLFQMLTGNAPFQADQPVNVMLMHLNDPVPTPSSLAPAHGIPASLDQVVLRCMQKEREARYASMDELLAALKAVRAELTGSTSSSSSSGVGTMPPAVRGSLAPQAVPRSPTGELPVVTPAVTAPPPAVSLPPPTGTPSGVDKKTLVLGIGAAVAAAVGAVALLTALTGPSAPTPSATVPGPSVAPPAPVPAPAPAAPSAWPLMVTSDPPGAAVLMGTALLGTTPLLVDLPGGTPESIRLALRLDGHAPAELKVNRVDGRYKGAATLAPAAAPPKENAPGRKPRGPRKPRESGADFKDDPY